MLVRMHVRDQAIANYRGPVCFTMLARILLLGIGLSFEKIIGFGCCIFFGLLLYYYIILTRSFQGNLVLIWENKFNVVSLGGHRGLMRFFLRLVGAVKNRAYRGFVVVRLETASTRCIETGRSLLPLV